MKRRLALWVAAACGVLTLTGAAAADTMELTGIVRDFKRGDQTGGHPDFQTAGAMSRFGLVPGMVTMTLGDDGKPVYNPTRPAKDTMKNAASFNEWYRDVPGVNLSAPLTLTLANSQANPKVFTYLNNSFWPIDGQMFGHQNCKDGSGKLRNFHFTYELHTKFSYRPGQYFTFIGDDDVFVFVNKTKVIDIGGVHAAETASVRLFDGKAFVNKNHFPLGGAVKSVDSAMASALAAKWNALGLGGACPIVSGDRYLDLDLNKGEADVMLTFGGASVAIQSAAPMASVTLAFTDGMTQKITTTASSGTFAGSGGNANKTLAGAWVKTNAAATGSGVYYAADGSGGQSSSLDFFFAERHTTQSNFRIDTSMSLETVPPTTISPLYD